MVLAVLLRLLYVCEVNSLDYEKIGVPGYEARFM